MSVEVTDDPPHIDAEERDQRAQEKVASDSTNAPQVEPVDRYRRFPTWLLPEPLGSLVSEASDAIGCDPSFVALPLLSATGAAIGNTTRLVVKSGWNVPPVIWSLIVGESGTAKSPAFKVAKAAAVQHQKKKLDDHTIELSSYADEKLRYEVAMKAWKKKPEGDPPEKPDPPMPERCLVSDTTVEALAPILVGNPRGVLLARDELNGWFGGMNQYKAARGSDEAFWLSAFDGESVTVDRKGEGTRPTFVPSALVSVTGGIQPEILSGALHSEHRASGLAARFLMAAPPRMSRRWTEDEVSESTRLQVDRLFLGLYAIEFADGESEANYVGMTAEAKSVWAEFFNAHEEEQCDLTGELAAAWSKLCGYVPRLALLLHVIEQTAIDAPITAAVDAKTMTAAIRLVEWFKGEAARLYTRLDDDDDQRELRELAEWIDRRHEGEVTPRQMVQGIKRLKKVEDAETECRRLVKAGLAEWGTVKPERGRERHVVRTV